MSIESPAADNASQLNDSVLIRRFIDPPTNRWQSAWIWLSEHANPIVVKEARQSLSSRQFSVSFTLTLLAVVFWTIMATMMQLPDMYYVPGGSLMLSGFLVILAFPLLLVIPFSAFRSMVIESEERTFELVSISALSAGQIVHGKMASACLQIVIYLSALAPCIVVTYLLRGVSLTVILNYLIYTVMLSVLLTGASILIATISRARLIQVFASICVLAGLLITFVYWAVAVGVTLNDSGVIPIEQLGWLVALAMTSIVASLSMVFLRCAAAAIDFPSENHAFALRLRIAATALILFFWTLWLALESESYEVCVAFMVVTLLVSWVMTGLIAGERGILSPRAQRTLPKTLIGRLFLTWFYPGAGLGYVFMCCLVTSLIFSWVALGLLGSSFQLGISHGEIVAGVGVAVWAYVVFYGGLTRILMYLIPRTVVARVLLGLLIQFFLIAFGALFPMAFMLFLTGFRELDYGWHQALNPFWTLSDISSYGITNDNATSLILLPLLAIPVFGLNLWLCGRDVLLIRIGLPPKLEEELRAKAQTSLPTDDPFQ
jgi:hypothetical protein